MHPITTRLLAAALVMLPPLARTASAQDTPPAASSAAVAPTAPGAHRLQARFDAANTSHDGHLTLSQAQSGGMRMVGRHFDEIDVGHKGYVTLDDVRQFTQAQRAARHGQAADAMASQ
ncbi:hypothetical protein [Lichenicoccus sp.]|uniref:hypothetical protein n=1 Tax=Lichenicoccus sp. TaxID=2781899 RepID=UPI003D0BE2AB